MNILLRDHGIPIFGPCFGNSSLDALNHGLSIVRDTIGDGRKIGNEIRAKDWKHQRVRESTIKTRNNCPVSFLNEHQLP